MALNVKFSESHIFLIFETALDADLLLLSCGCSLFWTPYYAWHYMCGMPILRDQGVHNFLDDHHFHKRFIISNTFCISQSPLGQFDWTGVLELLHEFVEPFDLWQMLLSSNLILWNHTLSSLSGVGHWISPRSAFIPLDVEWGSRMLPWRKKMLKNKIINWIELGPRYSY